MLLQLELSTLGCWVAGRYVGVLMYADDMLVMSVTLALLRTMLDIICDELSNLDMSINVKQSSLIRIGPRYKADISCVIVWSTSPFYSQHSVFRNRSLRCKSFQGVTTE